MILAHSHFRPLLRSRASRCFFFSSPGPLRASLCAPWPLLWARIFLKTDQRDFRKFAFLLSVQFWAPSHVPLAPDTPRNAPEALPAAFYLLFRFPPAHPRSIFAIHYYCFGTFSLSPLVASRALSEPLFGLFWLPWASLCLPGRFFGNPFSSKVGRPSLSKASFLTLWHPLGPKSPPTGARDSLKRSPRPPWTTQNASQSPQDAPKMRPWPPGPPKTLPQDPPKTRQPDHAALQDADANIHTTQLHQDGPAECAERLNPPPPACRGA